MRLIHFIALAGSIGLATVSVAARGSIVVTSVNQSFSVKASDAQNDPGSSGSGVENTRLPLKDFTQSTTYKAASASVGQEIGKYTGPDQLNKSASTLSLLVFATAKSNTPFSSASSDFTLNFTLDFAESFYYSRSSATDIQLLLVGKTRNVEVDPPPASESRTLGKGDYIMQVHATQTTGNGDSFFLGINISPSPEPAGLSILMVGTLLAIRRPRH